MKTYSELKAFVEKTNCKFELNPLYSEYEHYNLISGEWETNKILKGYEFGIENPSGRSGISEYIYVWFEAFLLSDEELNDDTPFFFRNKHNWASGKDERGVMTGIRCEGRMERRMAK